MSTKVFNTKLQHGFEETTMIREELKRLMAADPVIQNIKNHFMTKGVDRVKVDIIVNQAFADRELREKCLEGSKKRKLLAFVFFVLFTAGVAGWFYFWGDWITYFAGITFVLFLFFLQQSFSLRGKAEIYE